MNILSKIIFLGLIISLLAPGVYAVSFSLTSGGCRGTDSVGFAVSADKDALVKGSISANGASIDPVINIAGLGYLKENHQVTDTDGNHAEIHAEVVRGRNIHYEDSLTPGEGSVASTGSVSAQQTLTVEQSDYIKCSQSAYTLAGNKVGSGIELDHSALINYQGSASAATRNGDVTTQQALTVGQSDRIKITQSAYTTLNTAAGPYEARSGIELNHGALINYQGSSSAYTMTTRGGASTQQALTVGPSDYIRGFQNALYSAYGREVSADMEVDHGYLTKYVGSADAYSMPESSPINALQALTVGDSNYIKCTQSASDAMDAIVHKASAGLEVGKGSLTNYHGSADGTTGRSDYLEASRAFDIANGKQIEMIDRASASDDTAEASTSIQDGKISGFSNSVTPFYYGRYTTNLKPVIYETYSDTSGKDIEISASSSDPLLAKSNMRMQVKDAVIRNLGFDIGFILGGLDSATADFSSESISGKRIDLETLASNVEKDKASVNTYVDDGVASNVVVSAESGSQSAHANQNLDAMTGSAITVSTSASNAEKDKANAGIEIAGTKIQYGSISNLGSVADATVTTASASQNNILNNLNPLSVIGNKIDLDASASDKNGNTATLKTEVQKGIITNVLSTPMVRVNVDMSANTLSASQIASVVTGKKFEIDATTKNAENVKKHGDKTVSNPSNIAFHNTGSVAADTPAVDQGTP